MAAANNSSFLGVANPPIRGSSACCEGLHSVVNIATSNKSSAQIKGCTMCWFHPSDRVAQVKGKRLRSKWMSKARNKKIKLLWPELNNHNLFVVGRRQKLGISKGL